ncbi:methyltransferase [Reichenbachiella sp. 5M10]|uniref:class I SAM-dependent methyltransferase n=1 Tax=Reichenbachiella sp. 5M10 TaxID=1889772 RepID=UPI000C147780|nr:class I SAM-dependent methyltransferase [Reichenbachiella sp. 5M10]PIB34793.1 methyltransferase [Reichenbachiella sp. 5M10]
MTDAWQKRWDDRYSTATYAYGETPNEYFKAQLAKLEPGTILLPAEGEGRNAVFAAKSGWKVSAFDISSEGKNKALQLARTHNVTIDYAIGELPKLNYSKEQFDAIALIYAHFPADLKSDYHKLLVNCLKPGGKIIFEAFSKAHLEYRTKNEKIGGPRDIESLFSIEELEADFEHFESIELEEREIELKEGLYHNGKGSVVRFVGRKL